MIIGCHVAEYVEAGYRHLDFILDGGFKLIVVKAVLALLVIHFSHFLRRHLDSFVEILLDRVDGLWVFELQHLILLRFEAFGTPDALLVTADSFIIEVIFHLGDHEFLVLFIR